MATEQTLSGATNNTPPYIIFEAKEIITHQFDEDTQRYNFEMTDYLFDELIISLTENMIKDMYFYMQKEQANNRWFKHVQKYS
jgi:hypothetical protein